MMLHGLLPALRRNQLGTMAVETAIVAPVLALMAVGTFEAGSMVSRQQELQSAAAEAETIILAAATGEGADSNEVEDVIQQSLDLADDQFEMTQRFRCNESESLTSDAGGCDPDQPVYQYVLLEITDEYEPVWTNYLGVGSSIEYRVNRTVQVR